MKTETAAILALVGAAAVLLWNPIAAAQKAITDVATGAYDQVGGKNAAVAIDNALGIDTSGAAYQAWLAYHSGEPVTNPVTGVTAPSMPALAYPLVVAGNAVTPSGILANEALAGQQFSYELSANNDVERYNSLDTLQKDFVTGGQAIGSLFGVDLYAAGQDFIGWF